MRIVKRPDFLHLYLSSSILPYSFEIANFMATGDG
jgi:hypothetical protein